MTWGSFSEWTDKSTAGHLYNRILFHNKNQPTDEPCGYSSGFCVPAPLDIFRCFQWAPPPRRWNDRPPFIHLVSSWLLLEKQLCDSSVFNWTCCLSSIDSKSLFITRGVFFFVIYMYYKLFSTPPPPLTNFYWWAELLGTNSSGCPLFPRWVHETWGKTSHS